MESGAQIRVLPVQVTNKIAAGEVVERPASVLKELTENAVDAGATQIDVEIVSGGRKLVSVSDNGAGMNRDDALLSLERHATSKIRDVGDIEQIDTLGFRGEALAAIASVSRLRLVTCRVGEDAGTEIVVSGGTIRDVREIGCPPGTVIEVRDLFFNVPARRKFLRTYQTELSHVRLKFIVQALSRPGVAMGLTVDGRETYRLPGQGALTGAGKGEEPPPALADRLRDLFGAEYMGNLRPVRHFSAGCTVTGHVSIPAANRADRNEQYVFVNGRATSAPLIGYAVRESYRTLLPGGRHPLVFLFIAVDPGQVDVNVHPTKREVRFRRPGDVRDAVMTAIREALSSAASSAEDAPGIVVEPAEPRAAEAELKIEDLPPPRAFRYPHLPVFAPGAAPDTRHAPSDTPAPAHDTRPVPRDTEDSPWRWCRVLGQIGSLYVVLEIDDGYVLMDPHAAHERVLFEQFMQDVLEGSVATQTLLLPESVELAPHDALRLRKNLDLFRSMGFGISDFGADAFVVDAVPAAFAQTPIGAMLNEVAQGLEQAGARSGAERRQEETVAQAACRAAVKARDRLSLEEIEKLVVALASTRMPYTCPHGRPTLIFTSFRELNRKFGRE